MVGVLERAIGDPDSHMRRQTRTVLLCLLASVDLVLLAQSFYSLIQKCLANQRSIPQYYEGGNDGTRGSPRNATGM